MRILIKTLTKTSLLIALSICAHGQAMFYGGNTSSVVSKFGTPVNAAGHNAGSASSVAATALNTASGDLVVVATRIANTISVTSVTDTAGNTYTPLTGQTNGSKLKLYYVLAATANAANVVTVNFSGAATFSFVYVWDIHVTGSAAFDVEGGAGTASSVKTLTTSNFSTTGSDEIVLVAVGPNTTSEVAAISQSGYSLDSSSIDGGGYGGAAHGTFFSPQTGTNATMTWSTNATANIVAAAFK